MAFCNGQALTGLYFPAKNGGCQGPPAVTTLPVQKCSKIAGARGTSAYVTCQGGAFTFTTFSSIPPQPAGLRCDGGAAAADTLPLLCTVDPALVDEVSFEVGLPGRRPFLGFTAQPDGEGRVRAAVPGVRGRVRYEVRARSHRRGGREGNPGMWSDVTPESVACAAASGAAAEAVARRLGGPPTRWVEVYRVSHSAQADFLDNHNTGDETIAFAALAATTPAASAMTRYCVEIADVMLPGVVTASVAGEPQAAPFADYLSCNGGNCICMHQVDRSGARLPAKQILEMCSHPYVDGSLNTCRCPAAMDAQSLRHVGRCPIPLPFALEFSMEELPLRIPAGYPSPHLAAPMGHFLSFPVGGRCALGARVGEGNCTWQRAPLTHTVYGDDLRGAGLNASRVMRWGGPTGMAPVHEGITSEASLHNIEVGRKAFADLGIAPCGSAARGAAARGSAAAAPTAEAAAAATGTRAPVVLYS